MTESWAGCTVEAVSTWAESEQAAIREWRRQLEQCLRSEHGFGVDDLPGWRWQEGAYETQDVSTWCASQLSELDVVVGRFFFEKGARNRRTRSSYFSHAGVLADTLGGTTRQAISTWLMSPPDVARAIVEQIREELEAAGQSTSTIRIKLGVLEQLARHAYNADLIPERLKFAIPQQDRTRFAEQRPDYGNAIVEATIAVLCASREWPHVRAGAAIALVYELGLEPQELVALRTTDVSTPGGRLSLAIPTAIRKTDGPRSVRELGPPAVHAINAWRRWIPDTPGALFCRPDSAAHIDKNSVARGLKKALRALKRPVITMQNLRAQRLARIASECGGDAAERYARTSSYGSSQEFRKQAGTQRHFGNARAYGTFGRFLDTCNTNSAAACRDDFKTVRRLLAELGIAKTDDVEGAANFVVRYPDELKKVRNAIKNTDGADHSKNRTLQYLLAFERFAIAEQGDDNRKHFIAHRFAPAARLDRLERAAEALPDDILTSRAAAEASLYRHEGLRLSEAAQLTLDDVVTAEAMVRIRKKAYTRSSGDTATEWKAMSAQTKAAVDAWLRLRGTGAGALFTSLAPRRFGKHLSRETLYRDCRRYEVTARGARNRGLLEKPRTAVQGN